MVTDMYDVVNTFSNQIILKKESHITETCWTEDEYKNFTFNSQTHYYHDNLHTYSVQFIQYHKQAITYKTDI